MLTRVMFFFKATFFLILVEFCWCNLTWNPPDDETIVKAVGVFWNEYLGSKNTELYIVNPIRSHRIDDQTTSFINFFKWPVQVEKVSKVIKDRRRVNVVSFVSDFEAFQKFSDGWSIDAFHPNGFYSIVFPEATSDELNLMFDLLWKKFVCHVNIITQMSEDVIEMFTFMPFSNTGKCGDTAHVKINQFDTRSMTWANKKFYPKKLKDLHGCVIRGGAFSLPPAIIVNRKDNEHELHGFDVDILNELLHSLNAVVNYTVFPISTGKIFANGTVTGLLGHTMRGDVDVSLRSWSLQLDRKKILTETISYFSDKLIMIMPLAQPLNPLLKFVRPMQAEAWYAIGAVIFIASAVIFMLKLVPKHYYRRIIGKDLRDEFLNILIGFVGLSQTAVPEKNFPRFLLMMFLIFCLIIRSLYLGSLFNMLKTEIRSKEFVSIKDFYQAGFQFYMYDSLAERLDYPEVNER